MLEPGGADFSEVEQAPDTPADPALSRAHARLVQGRIREAMEAVAQVERETLTDQSLAWLSVIGIVCCLARGDVRGTAPFVRDLTPLSRKPGVTGALAAYGLAETDAARGYADRAVPGYRRAGELVNGSEPWLPWRSGLAQLLAVNRQVAEAAGLAETEVAVARQAGWPYAIAYSLRTLSTVAATDTRIDVLTKALAAIDGFRADRLEAQIRTDLAGWLVLLQPESADRAVDELRMAERYALAEELWPLIARIRRLLERLGEEPIQLRDEQLKDLSPAERRVAELALAGDRNRDIAEKLGVSIKSVERHMSQVLRKVGVSSRTELATTIGTSPH
jgi:DNA-binding NarL/FixJ family response regulator